MGLALDFCIGEVEHHRHRAREHMEHRTGAAVLPAALPGEAEIDPADRLALLRLPDRGGLGKAVDGPDLVDNQLGRFFVPHRDPAAHHQGAVLHQQVAAAVHGAGKGQQLHGAGVILQGHIGHDRVVAGGLHLHGLHHARNLDGLAVGVVLSALLKAGQNLADGTDAPALEGGAVVVHGMARQVQARDLPLLAHAHLGRQLRQVGNGHAAGRLVHGRGVEEAQLPLHVPAAALGHGVHHRVVNRQQLAPPEAEAVAGAALNQILQRPLVELRGVHPAAEVLQAPEGPVFRPLLHHLVDKAPANVLHRGQAEADALGHHGKVGGGLVQVRRQHRQPQVLAGPHIGGHLSGAVQHRGHQGGHVLLGIVAL